MKKFYLVSNVSQNCKYVVTKRWYHKFIGAPMLTVDKCIAKNKRHAERLFLRLGHNFGLLHRDAEKRNAQ